MTDYDVTVRLVVGASDPDAIAERVHRIFRDAPETTVMSIASKPRKQPKGVHIPTPEHEYTRSEH